VRDALDGRAVTVALDGVGGEAGRTALELLGPAGRLVLFGFSSGALTRLDAMDVFGRGLTVTGAIGARILQRPGGLRDLETPPWPRPRRGAWCPLSTATRWARPRRPTRT